MTMEKYKTIRENKVMINPPDEIKRFKQSPLQRILRVMKFYYNRGINSERVNIVYRNIIKNKYPLHERIVNDSINNFIINNL